MLADKQTCFEKHHHQKYFIKKNKKKKKLKSYICSYIILSCSAFNCTFITNVVIFSIKSELSINPKTSDLLTNSLFF